jgi:hypothetical protein
VIAWQEYSYLIVALNCEQDPKIQSWILNEQRVFEPEAICCQQETGDSEIN